MSIWPWWYLNLLTLLLTFTVKTLEFSINSEKYWELVYGENRRASLFHQLDVCGNMPRHTMTCEILCKRM